MPRLLACRMCYSGHQDPTLLHVLLPAAIACQCQSPWGVQRRFHVIEVLTCLRQELVRLFAGISSHSEDHGAHFTRSGKLVCLFVCLFVWVKPENLYFAPCVWREVITPGNGCTRNQAQKLSFTQDGLAFSTKTARRTLQDHVRDTKNTVVQI